MGLGDWIHASFGFLGPTGLLVAMFLIFFVDAVVFPALPEVFIVLFYFELAGPWAWSPIVAGGSLLALAVLGDLTGNFSLYRVVKYFHQRGRVPRRIEAAMRRWTKFLLTSNERILLMNRVAPAVPMTGAFIAVCGWDLRKSLAYIGIGGATKYSVVLGLVAGLGVAFDPGIAQWITISAILLLVSASVVWGQVRRRRMEAQPPP